MGFKKHVSVRQEGWRTTTIYSSDGENWRLQDGTQLDESDIREDSTHDDLSGVISVILGLLFLLLIFKLLCI
jgi:hypothetical protein